MVVVQGNDQADVLRRGVAKLGGVFQPRRPFWPTFTRLWTYIRNRAFKLDDAASSLRAVNEFLRFVCLKFLLLGFRRGY